MVPIDGARPSASARRRSLKTAAGPIMVAAYPWPDAPDELWSSRRPRPQQRAGQPVSPDRPPSSR